MTDEKNLNREELLQIIHQSENSRAVTEQLIPDYEERIEKLRKDNNNLKKSEETSDDDDDEEILIYRQKIDALTRALYEESIVEEEEIEENISKEASNVEVLEKELEQSKEKNVLLKNQIEKAEVMKLQLEERKVNVKVNQLRIIGLNDEMNNLKTIVDDKKSQYECLSSEYRELQNENKSAESELALLKAGPIGEINRGNNLFSEVEENSGNITFKKKQLTSKYNAKKTKLKQVILEIDKLKYEIAELKKQGSNRIKKESSLDNNGLEKAKSLVNQWEAKLADVDKKELTLSSQSPGWIEQLLEKENEEYKLSRDEANKASRLIYQKVQELLRLEVLKVEITEVIDDLKSQLSIE